MEHNLEDSKPSSTADEPDRSDIGTGRSYECVFCKRGFTTAQALGGHMNIHRKDRVKTKTTTATTSIASNSSKSVGANQVTQSFPSHHLSMASELHINYQTYFPSSTWSLGSTASHDKDELYVHNPQLLNSLKENWHRNLSNHVGAASHTIDHHIQEKRSAGNGEEDELDLELRLGHDR